MTDAPKLLQATQDLVTTLTINRPQVRNAIDTETMGLIKDAVQTLANDDATRVIVLTGAGDIAFSAGGDMKEMQEFSALSGDQLMEVWQSGLEVIENSRKPVICAINGFAYGGGTEIAMACQIRVAVEGARLGQTEIALDHLPGGGGTQRLPRLVPLGFAYEHLVTGEPIEAHDAWRVGLVNHVWPRPEFEQRTMDLALRIAARAPVAVQYTLDAIREGLKGSLSTGMRLERALASIVLSSDAAQKGLEDFFGAGRRAGKSDKD